MNSSRYPAHYLDMALVSYPALNPTTSYNRTSISHINILQPYSHRVPRPYLSPDVDYKLVGTIAIQIRRDRHQVSPSPAPHTLYQVSPCPAPHTPYLVPVSCTIDRVLCTMYRVLCAVYRVPCTVYPAPCALSADMIPCTVWPCGSALIVTSLSPQTLNLTFRRQSKPRVRFSDAWLLLSRI